MSRRDELRIREEEERRADALKRIYEAWSHSAPASDAVAEWIDVEGLADQLVDEWGRRADFIVLKRPMDHQLDQERRAIHAALFDTGRPVLVVPPEAQPAPFGRRIAIAWRDDGRTIKAVLSGLRCATRAEEIHVLAGTRDAAAPPRLPDIFDEHGITARLHVLPIRATGLRRSPVERGPSAWRRHARDGCLRPPSRSQPDPWRRDASYARPC